MKDEKSSGISFVISTILVAYQSGKMKFMTLVLYFLSVETIPSIYITANNGFFNVLKFTKYSREIGYSVLMKTLHTRNLTFVCISPTKCLNLCDVSLLFTHHKNSYRSCKTHTSVTHKVSRSLFLFFAKDRN